MRILFLLAHPDDETFGPGATIAKYARLGHEVHLVAATRGEAGMTGSPPLTDRDHLGEFRSAELEEAAAVLGAAKIHFLGFRDGELASVPRERLVESAVRVIRLVCPHVLMSFGPYGVSGHADHKVMCEVALTAYERAGDPGWYPGHFRSGEYRCWTPFKLYQFELSLELLSSLDIPLHGVSEEMLTTIIDTSADAETKLRAFQCHRTQHKDVERIMSRPGFHEFLRRETYVLAKTRLEGLLFPESDLLAGISEQEEQQWK
ncbi:MAG: PIG-L family deacetylase [Syntrophorhabdaceae bacterium]|nr:PIG-L family deacetylase [Syntrophorhabdaceae bacterium]